MPKDSRKFVSSRKELCFVCKENISKYTCPKCKILTCSLPCVKKHKKEVPCDGIRNKTEYVDAKKMNEMHLLSDYRFLEDVARRVNSCTRDTKRKHTRKNAPLPEHLQKFRKAVSERGTRIYFMPKSFVKHQENTTFLDWKTRKISWKLHVTFLHAQQYRLTVDRCPEDTLIEIVIQKCITAAKERKKDYRKHFDAYDAAMEDIVVLMKVEKMPLASNSFYVLDNTKSLKENLIGKRIVEFPEIYVAVKRFYSTAISVQGNTKSKLGSFLLPNDCLNEDKQSDELSSSDKEDSTSDSDEDDSLANIKQHKEILSQLYKIAYVNP